MLCKVVHGVVMVCLGLSKILQGQRMLLMGFNESFNLILKGK